MSEIDLENANLAPRKVTLVKGKGKIGTEHYKNYIIFVKRGSVAESAGIKLGDQIISVNGVEVDCETTSDEVQELIGKQKGGVEMIVRYDPQRCNEAIALLFMKQFY